MTRTKTLISILVIFAIMLTACSNSANSLNSSENLQGGLGNTKTPDSSNSGSNVVLKTANKSTGILKVNYLNVGQGDSEFVELPNGQTMLIDAGLDGEGNNIVNYIKSKGYHKIDYLIATHSHLDHIGGMKDVVKQIDIASVYIPKIKNSTTKIFKKLLKTIDKKGLKINKAKAGVSLIDTKDLKVYMIAPNSKKYKDLNNYSAVIKIVYKKNSFLFMGDAQQLSEDEIKANVKSNVIKIGQHGSSTATGEEFLKKVTPEYAIISAGSKNTNGNHPSQVTLDKLKAIGAKTYITNKDGTIIITSDGKKLSVTTDKFSAINGKDQESDN